MSYLLSLCLLIVLAGDVQSSFFNEDFEQNELQSILKPSKTVSQKRVTFAPETSLEPKPLTGKYAKKAILLKKAQEKRNDRLGFAQLLEKQLHVKIMNIELEEEKNGELSIQQQQELVAFKMQSLIFQQKKLEVIANKEKTERALKKRETRLKEEKRPVTRTHSLKTKNLSNVCSEGDSSGSSTEEMLPILDEETVQPETIERTKPLLKRSAPIMNLQESTGTSPKRPRIERSKTQSGLSIKEQDSFLPEQNEGMDFCPSKDKQNLPLRKRSMQPLLLVLEEESHDDPQSLFPSEGLERSSSFLIALPQDEKTFLTGGQYEKVRGVPSRETRGSPQKHKGEREKISKTEQGSPPQRQPLGTQEKKNKGFPARTFSFRVTNPEEINAFFQHKDKP